jgi:hypothetical protein
MSKMASHEPFGHLQHELWSKEGPGVKLAIWLPITKSQESTRSRCVQVECNTPLESSQGELQLFFRPCPNRRSEREVMNAQSPESPNRNNFGIPLWGSQEKVPFGCKCGGEMQRILYGGKVAASPESRPWWVKWVQGCPWLVLTPRVFQMNTNQFVGWFWMQDWVTKYFVPFPSQIPELSARPSYPPL